MILQLKIFHKNVTQLQNSKPVSFHQ